MGLRSRCVGLILNNAVLLLVCGVCLASTFFVYFSFIGSADEAKSSAAEVALGVGLLLSVLLCVIARLLLTARDRAVVIAEGMTRTSRDGEEIQHRLALAAQSANEAKTEFLTNMSHELRTPMTAILGYTDILAEMIPLHENPDAMRSNVHRIKESGSNLLAMINDVLDLSIIEEGKLEIVGHDCYVPEILSEVLSSMKPHADHRGIALDARFETPVPICIVADAFRVRQILTNLISNAIKFTNHGAVTVVVRVDGEAISFSVKDTGIGIEESKLESLFHRFEQADNTLTRKYGGIGLGLTISKHLALLMEGSLEVDSVVGKGSIFVLEFPLVYPEGPRRMITQHFEDDDFKNKSQGGVRRHMDYAPLKGRVLLAEDGDDNQRLIRHFLTKAGVDVVIVQNGKLALDLYEKDRSFDLIIMDMQMPVLDGYQATTLLRENGCDLPILALTAHAMHGDRERCLECGCDEYQTKPIDRTKLLKTVKHMLEFGRSGGRRAA